MAITLAAQGLSDAEITDGIARGDISSAARLWVRLWPTALNAAREFVDPAEVPGLAAKALIGTITVIAVGRGPREDVKSFLRAAVRELGDDNGPPPPRNPGAWSPDVSTSPIMSGAFARLPDMVQDLLWITVVGDRADELIAEALDISTTAAAAVRIEALTTLQREHLTAHADRVEDLPCRLAHAALARAVEDPAAAGLSRDTWMHLSACAWCTEAFHELVFSNAAIGALVDRAGTASQVVPPIVEPLIEVADVGGLVEPARVALPADPPPRGGLHAGVASSSPGFVRRRGRILAGALAVVAGAVVVTLILSGHGADRSAPLEAAGPATPAPAAASALSGASPGLTSTSDATAAHGITPGAAVGDQPSTTPTPRAPKSRTATSSSPKPAPTPRPSPTTTSSDPAETSTPTPTPPPTPAPAPTPTPCSVLEHLLGLC